MPAAIAVPALIGAGASLGSAAIGARAAGKASKTQAQAADRVAGIHRDIYGQQMGLMSPYVGAGHSSISTLGRLLAPPGGSRFAAPAPMAPGFGGPDMGTPATITLRAPDGSTQAVTSHLADQFIARGAVRVDGAPRPLGSAAFRQTLAY